MKHKNEIDALLKELLYEDWMNDKDWKELEQQIPGLLKKAGTSYEEMSDEIDTGIANGLSLESQMAIIKQLLQNRR